jgi:hypothetical protein
LHPLNAQEPARAGIDRYRKLIDRQRDDNVIGVEAIGANSAEGRPEWVLHQIIGYAIDDSASQVRTSNCSRRAIATARSRPAAKYSMKKITRRE